jgi:hypothetical protein
VELARRLDDPLAECAALFALTGAQRRAGDTFAAAATARRRVDLLHSVPVTPGTADELIDALLIATATSIGVGDLPAARRWGRQLRDLPPLAEVGHVATSRLLMADALAGHATDVIAASGRFLDAWTQAGHPRARSFGPVAAAVAMIHGLRGDQAARAEWLAIIDQLGVTPKDRAGYSPTFDAIALLHHGQATLALERLDIQADEPNLWLTGILLHWHVALRAEAAVLAGHPDATHYLAAARPIVAGNPIASAIVDRAAALLNDDHERLLATATAFETAGCPYQRARRLSWPAATPHRPATPPSSTSVSPPQSPPADLRVEGASGSVTAARVLGVPCGSSRLQQHRRRATRVAARPSLAPARAAGCARSPRTPGELDAHPEHRQRLGRDSRERLREGPGQVVPQAHRRPQTSALSCGW